MKFKKLENGIEKLAVCICMLLLVSCASVDIGGASNYFENHKRAEANDKYNMSPKKRIVKPKSYALSEKIFEFSPNGCEVAVPAQKIVTFDFGVETGGVPVLKYRASGDGDGKMSFTESSKFIGVDSDSSNGDNNHH